METSYELFNGTSYYDAGQLSENLSDNDNVGGPLECKQEINSDGLFNFIICGVLVNLIGIFGIFGNAISMIILSRPQMKSSINYLLIGLARCDTMLIVISMLIYGLPAIYPYTGLLFDYKFIVYPKIVRFLYPLSCIAQIATVYLTLTVTLERYIAVCHPLKARSFCTYGRAQLAVLIIVVFSLIYNLPKFWEIVTYTEVHWKYNVTVYCLYPAELRRNDLYVTLYVHWMYFFICYLFPFLALVVFNAAIYLRVRKANRDLQQLSRHQRREIGLATMLLCVVIVFLICNILPLASNIHETFLNDPPLWLVQTGNLLVTINSSINFIIYVIFGRKFKRIFLKLFCSSKLFGPGRDSPEFQTYDESIVTNTTNIELRNSIRHYHLNRSSTIGRNNNNSNGSTRQSMKASGRPGSPGPCVYYPATSPVTSPSQISRTSSTRNNQNGWSKKDIDSVL
ncbi:FMRFamide receptor-like [Hylaeus volcanicus]|uniref:FMRFamide receptor-like n=1 Tax=Hylaeus volcanicus TaxID=313075 RepID=UPI0023B7761A|nr:FMRFamide receptor-like [Hylaeus volcanicus]XP_053987233.1 FMRFamide receptor-like [Hylaeus volcanicus]XP_053987234.1 FMRFamide receptor-like [Hylaeus volcanicus]XP_053987236.1 FMRFamide receptor-like [Hylaeus volcanicus]XP_053987237.1 FMRFamide receptor-like [Hylaeus volcanicus]